MAAISRLGYEAYGVKRAGDFSGKTMALFGPHPVGQITRLSLDGYGARRYGANAFGSKTDAGAGAGQTVLRSHPFLSTMSIFMGQYEA